MFPAMKAPRSVKSMSLEPKKEMDLSHYIVYRYVPTISPLWCLRARESAEPRSDCPY